MKKKNQYTESLFHLPKISICQWQYAKLTKGTEFPKIIFLWFLYTLWTPLKQFPFIFLMGGEKEGSFAEKGPYHHRLQQPKVKSAWLWPSLAEESELTLCSSRQGSGASPFLTCMRSLLPFMSHSLHGSDTSIAPPRACCSPTKIWGSTGIGEIEADLIPPMA